MQKALTIEEINERISSFTKLTAIDYTEIKYTPRRLLFRCECGNKKTLPVKEVLRSKIKSCGCLQPSLTIKQVNDKLIGTRLTVLSFAEPSKTKRGWEIRRCICKCICGKIKSIKLGSLTTGATKSCGCLEKDTKTKYSHNHREIYSLWKGILSRCYVVENNRYKDYGGKGVIMCDEWKNDYQAFLTWCLNNGWQKGLQLDKDIKGTDKKIYSPSTCIFVTRHENMMHTTRAFQIEYNGAMINLRVLCHELGIDAQAYKLIYERVKNRGWDFYLAVNTPKLIGYSGNKKYTEVT